jgi:sterol desaturase/sphingolipid hydroxylase (fatty acid hydroxylase superfamily)
MLKQQEKDFIIYWEQNRQKQRKTFRQFLVGIPIGLLFAIPILINFISGWHKRAEMDANNPDDFSPLVLMIALLLIIAFVAIFSKHHQWEMREQRYRELIAKQSVDQKDVNDINGEK